MNPAKDTKFSYHPVRFAVAGFFSFLLIMQSLNCGTTERLSNQDREKFIKVYVELTLAREKLSDSSRVEKAVIQQIMSVNDVDKEFLDDVKRKMSSNLKLQSQVYREINDRLKVFEKLPPDSLEKQLRDVTEFP